MQGIPPGLATLESTAHHLHVNARRLQALTAQTPLRRVAPVSLGRSLGTYRLIPQLGIAVLRQVNADTPYHLQAWQAALADLLASDTWLEATAHLNRWRPRGGEARGGRFGTQVYAFDPAGTVALVQAAQPAFLDACLVPPAVPPPAAPSP